MEHSGISFVYIPSLAAYTDDEKTQPSFNHKDIETIWKKVNVPDWKKIKNWEKIERQDEVEEMISTFMRKHLTQIQGTPLTSDEWDYLLTSSMMPKRIY